ncbi:MAG: SDR family oxidoreductase [Candidatus Aminicenantes bacterium]|nr:SDR family oxidoreductase [Candidatus Aminicenantes bacterium]
MNKNHIAITGASSEIGQAIVQELQDLYPQAFFTLHCLSRPAALAAVLAQFKEHGQIVAANFLDEQALTSFLKQIQEVDILINAAAVTQMAALPQLDAEAIRQMIQVNIEAFTLICQTVIPAMVAKRRGCIVNISSVAASRGNRGQTVYAGTKGYMEAFTRSLAAEYGSRGIRVNCIAPGPIQAGNLNGLLDYAAEEVKKSVALPRLGTAKDVAHLTAFLCSDKATFINGKTIGIDGGFMTGV